MIALLLSWLDEHGWSVAVAAMAGAILIGLALLMASL